MAELAKKHNLSLVVLFGSQATGHTHKMSDIDVGYISGQEIDYGKSYEITIELCQIFKNRDVELVNIDNVSPSHKKQISDTGIVLFEENSMVYDLYKMYALREYIDTKPLRLYRKAYINNFLEKYA